MFETTPNGSSIQSECRPPRPSRRKQNLVLPHLVECKKRLFEENDEEATEKEKGVPETKERSSVKKQKVVCKYRMMGEILDPVTYLVALATRYHRQIPNQPFVVLTSHENERFYLFVHDNDEEDNFKVRFSDASHSAFGID